MDPLSYIVTVMAMSFSFSLASRLEHCALFSLTMDMHPNMAELAEMIASQLGSRDKRPRRCPLPCSLQIAIDCTGWCAVHYTGHAGPCSCLPCWPATDSNVDKFAEPDAADGTTLRNGAILEVTARLL